MTEFARKPSKLRRFWSRFRFRFLPKLRLFFASDKKATEILAESERRKDFWTEAAFIPAAPDPAPETPVEGLSIRLDSHGVGTVFFKGVELRWVQAIYISVAPLQPVEVTLLMSGFDGIDLQSDLCSLRFESVGRVQPND